MEITIEIHLKPSTTQETIEKILTLPTYSAVYGEVSIKTDATVAAEPQVIEPVGIPAQGAFGTPVVTLRPASAQPIVKILAIQGGTIIRDLLIQIAAALITIQLSQNLLQHKDFIESTKVITKQESKIVSPDQLGETLKKLLDSKDLGKEEHLHKTRRKSKNVHAH